VERHFETRKGKFVIRPYRSGDEEGVLALWEVAFGKKMAPEVWRWKYLNNPYGCQILLCVSEAGQIVTMYSGIPYRAHLEGKTIRMTQLTDSMSHPAYRADRVFARTGREFYEYFAPPEGSVFFYGFPGRFHFKLGQRILQYHLAKNVSFLSALPEDIGGRKRFGGRIERIQRVTYQFDRLAERCQSSYPLFVIRDAAFLKWRFCEHPQYTYEIWGYRPYFHNELKAYAVFTIREQAACLIDILAPDSPAIISDFLFRLAKEYQKRDIETISTWLPEGHFITRALITSGLKPAPEPLGIIPTIRSMDPNWPWQKLSERIYYTMADADLY